MKVYKYLFKFLVSILVLACLLTATYLNFEHTDPYLTDKYYHAWLSGLASISLFSEGVLGQVIFVAAKTIKAPEPVPHFLAFITTQVFNFKPENILHLFSVLILVLLSFSISHKKKEIVVQLLLLFLISAMSFYWFVLFNITHRLKISILFLILSFIFAYHKKKRAASWFFVLSVFSHFSILLIAPFLYMLNKDKLVTPISSAYQVFIQILTCIGVMIIYLSLGVDDVTDFEPLINLIRNKTYFLFEILEYTVIPILVIFALALNKIENNLLFKHRNIFGAIAMAAIMLYFGTSRVLMLIHVTITIVVFFNPKILRIKTGFRLHHFVIYFWIFLAYDLYKYTTTTII